MVKMFGNLKFTFVKDAWPFWFFKFKFCLRFENLKFKFAKDVRNLKLTFGKKSFG